MGSPFVGDSGMAGRMRAISWASTPLGPPEAWPAPLCTTLALILRSRLPMYVAWGPRRHLLYNDAYAPLLGARHPDALGAEFAAVWPEVWPALKDTFAAVRDGAVVHREDLPIVLERRGRPEEAYFTYSLGAVGDGTGDESGVFCVCTEATGRVVGTRRLRVLAALGELPAAPDPRAALTAAVGLLGAHRADVPAALLYLLDDDRGAVRLVAAEGVATGGALAPPVVGLDTDTYWAPLFRQVLDCGRGAVVHGLADALPDGRLPGAGPPAPVAGPGDRVPFDAAVVLPLDVPEVGTGLLVAAASPYLELDADHRAFLDLVGHHVATAAASPAQHRPESVDEALWWLQDDAPADPPGDHRPEAAGRILVVDDNPDMRRHLVRLLRRTHRTEAVADGAAALATAVADPPDLVLADVATPRLDGLALLAALRDDPRTSLVPVVLMSARAGSEAAVEGLGAGADDYLVKPFSARELRARVAGRVALGRARREAERRFRAMADSTPALIWADGPDGRRLFVNRGWAEFTGAEPDAELGAAWRDRIHPADRERYAAVRAAAADGPFEVEYRLRAADGRHRWVLDRGAPADGYPGGHVGGCLDIDTRVRERERQRLLAVVGTALDRETTVAGRRGRLVRTLVDEGLVDMARFIEVDDGPPTAPPVVAARTPRQEEQLRRLDVDWMRAREVIADGVVRRYDVDDDFVRRSTTDERQRELRRRIGFGAIVLVPLATRGHASGLLAVARTRASGPFDDGDAALLAQLGERAATAVDNALLLEHEQANLVRLQALQRATAALSAAATPEQVARAAATEFALLSRATAVTLWRLTGSGDDAVLEAVDGLEVAGLPDVARRVGLDEPVPPAQVARSGRPVWSAPDAGPDEVDHIPLVAAGACVGVVGLAGHPRELRAGPGGAALTVLAKLCAQALARAGLLGAERTARHTAEELGEVVGALAGATTPVAVAKVVLDHVVRLGASAAAVLVRRAEHLEVLAVRGAGRRRLDRRLPLNTDDPVARAARTGEAVWAGDDPQVAVPLLLGGPGRPLGVLAVWFAEQPAPVRDRAAVLTLAGQCAQALDRARLHQAEHDVADVLQRSLLPHELPALPQLRAAARYLPSAVGVAAGGDWYDVLPLAGRSVALVVGDVVGHGAPAAAVMGQLRSALAAYLLDGHSPAAALERLDRFARRVPGAAGSTCVCLVLDCTTGELRWSRAGHPPVLLLEPAGPRYLDDAGGTVLGVRGRPPYPEATAVISPGSSVLLYTDGLVERRGEVIDEGQERLARAAAAIRDLAPDELVSRLADAALATGTLGDPGQPDDVALVAVRLVPEPLHGRLPAQPRQLRVMRRAVEEWAAAVGLSDDVLDDLQYALGEAAANAVEHAYGQDVRQGPDGEFSYRLAHVPGDDGGITVEVRDDGRWRPVPADPGHRGRGVQVMHAIGRDVSIASDEGGTTVAFRVPVPGPADPVRQRRARGASPAAGARASVAVVPAADRPTLRIAGDLDLDGVAAVRPVLLAAVAPGALLVDLCDTGYVSSAGVALLVELAATARDHGTRLALRVAPASPLARVLELTGLQTVLVSEAPAVPAGHA